MPRRRLNPHRRPRDMSLWPTGADLREARNRAGVSVDVLAGRLRWSRASLYEYERAARVDPEYAAAIRAALGAEPAPLPISLELVDSGTCGGRPECIEERTAFEPLEQHGWWDFRVLVPGRTFPTLYRVHAILEAPGDAAWHEVPHGGPITRWIFADLAERTQMLREAVLTAADPWPSSGFDPTAYRDTPPWRFWR